MPASGGEWVTTQSADLDPEEEAQLAAFLQKVSGACQRDASVPGYVGNQVNEWLAEIATTGSGEVGGSTGEAPDANATPVAGSGESAGNEE